MKKYSLERIIDVNLNRLREGLKVCEDILRFHYEDKELLFPLRKIRQSLFPYLQEIEKILLPFRKSEIDLGRGEKFDKGKRKDIREIFSVNIKRCEEACRVLEEVYKIKTGKGSPFFKSARFSLYDLEKSFHLRYGKTLNLQIYAILDVVSLKNFFSQVPPLSELAYRLATGADVIQLRGRKDSSTSELLRQAISVKRGIEKAMAEGGAQPRREVKFIINDRIDISLSCDADGVHLGKGDIPPLKAREILPEKIIGWTVRNKRDLKIAEKSGCDYVGCGSVFPSPTKPSAPVIGLKGLRAIVRESSLPVVAIGGINLKRLPSVLKTGVSGVALSSALLANGEIEKNLAKMRKISLKTQK